ncbi:NUDIX hydrolase [bacterium]|nr:NUDIX hydrolase [bacterium]
MANLPTHLVCPHCGQEIEKYRNPFPTVDVLIRYRGGIVLIERGNPPHGWAIPGGFMEYGESAETCARREMMEETGLELDNLELFTVRSEPDRDPRFHTVTIVFTADGLGELQAGDDADNARVFTPDNVPEQMAFDHGDVLTLYNSSVR